MRAHLINFEEEELDKVRDLFPGIILTDKDPDITLNKNTLAFKDPFSLAICFLTYAGRTGRPVGLYFITKILRIYCILSIDALECTIYL